jgi:hypothetical protein
MKKLVALLFAFALTCSVAFAQAAAPATNSSAPATKAPVATKAHKKHKKSAAKKAAAKKDDAAAAPAAAK